MTKPNAGKDPALCRCGSGKAYDVCCAIHHGGMPAPTAEALMRSRYCAYVYGLRDYLLATWHPSTRPAMLEADSAGLRWLGLEVRRSQLTGPNQGEVEFVARSKLGGRAQRLHECSRFVHEDGQWWYVDGQFE